MHSDSTKAAVKALLADPGYVIERLGLSDGARRTSQGFLVRCPAHQERTPSCHVYAAAEGLFFKCHGCGISGDVFSLVAAVHGLDARRDFPEVIKIATEISGFIDSSAAYQPRAPQSPLPPIDRPYPPEAEILALWESCGYVSEDAEVSAWLKSRHLDPVAIDSLAVGEFALARALPQEKTLPAWAGGQRKNWEELGFRCLLPLWDSKGQLRSLRARRIRPSQQLPKSLPPRGYKLSGLVLSDAGGLSTLRQNAILYPEQFVIVEGEVDFLLWATRESDAAVVDYGVFGISSGAWTKEVALKVPTQSVVFIRTDRDPAGDQLADVIRGSLKGRCRTGRAQQGSCS